MSMADNPRGYQHSYGLKRASPLNLDSFIPLHKDEQTSLFSLKPKQPRQVTLKSGPCATCHSESHVAGLRRAYRPCGVCACLGMQERVPMATSGLLVAWACCPPPVPHPQLTGWGRPAPSGLCRGLRSSAGRRKGEALSLRRAANNSKLRAGKRAPRGGTSRPPRMRGAGLGNWPHGRARREISASASFCQPSPAAWRCQLIRPLSSSRRPCRWRFADAPGR